jgi:hypothetical protein
MRVRAMVAVLALAGLLAGCGGHSSSQRPALASYINQINQIEKQLQRPFQAVTTAGSRFASSNAAGTGPKGAAAVEQTLLGALRQIRADGRRLAQIPPPAPAVHLRTLLLQLVHGEAGMTTELSRLVTFLPRFSTILSSLTPATAKLQAALRVTQPLGSGTAGVTAELAVKAKALHTFEEALFAAIKRLRRLTPPALSKPQFVTQIKTLERMQSTAGKLANALAASSRNVPTLLQAFDRAAAGNQTLSAQHAQIAAIKAYDANAVRLDALAKAVEEERLRLDRNLK